MTETTTPDHLAIEADAFAERRLHGRVLMAGTATSVGCNVWHALITGSQGPLGAAGAAVIALIAPLCLLVGTHSLLMHLWARNPFATWFDHTIKAFSALVFLGVSACAFAISYHGLKEVAEMSRIMPGIAGLFPLMLDGLLIVSGVCLLASVRLQASARRAQQAEVLDHIVPAEAPIPAAAERPAASMPDVGGRPVVLDVRAEERPVPAEVRITEPHEAELERPTTTVLDLEAPMPTPHHVPSALDDDVDRYVALAQRIQSGRSETTSTSIAEALRLVDTGCTHKEAADIVGVDRSTVSRWCDKAKTARLDTNAEVPAELVTT